MSTQLSATRNNGSTHQISTVHVAHLHFLL